MHAEQEKRESLYSCQAIQNIYRQTNTQCVERVEGYSYLSGHINSISIDIVVSSLDAGGDLLSDL